MMYHPYIISYHIYHIIYHSCIRPAPWQGQGRALHWCAKIRGSRPQLSPGHHHRDQDDGEVDLNIIIFILVITSPTLLPLWSELFSKQEVLFVGDWFHTDILVSIHIIVYHPCKPWQNRNVSREGKSCHWSCGWRRRASLTCCTSPHPLPSRPCSHPEQLTWAWA